MPKDIIEIILWFSANFLDTPIARWVAFVFSILGGLGGLILVYRMIHRLIFKKRIWLAKLEQLATSTTIAWFSNMLGTPVFTNERGAFVQYVYVNPLFYVDAIANKNHKVISYSVTTRHADFNPKLKLGPYSTDGVSVDVKLGQTT